MTHGKRSAAMAVRFILGTLAVLVNLALVLTVVALAVGPFVSQPLDVDVGGVGLGARMKIPVSVLVTPAALPISAPSLGVTDARLVNLRGMLTFPSEFGAFYVANGLVLVVILIAVGWVLHQMRAVFATISTGQPFVAANARRLRQVAVAIIVGEVVATTLIFLQHWYAATYFSGRGILFRAEFNLSLTTISLGLIVLAIAEVFAAGTRLDEDQSLTI